MAEPREWPLAATLLPSPPISRARRSSRASRSCSRARTPEEALGAGHAAPARARRRAGRDRRRPRRSPRSSGGASTRCCSGSSACSPRTSRTWPTAPSLSAHQVDALSGTLIALHRRGAAQRQRQRRTATAARATSRASCPPATGEEDRGRRGATTDEEPLDWEDEDEEDEDVRLAERPEDPNAARRFWFEHATGAGKTVAALGFVEASRTGGILILTHRRNLVDQFHGELRDRGYAKRISPALLRRQGRAASGRPGHGRDLPVVRAQRRQDLGRLHDRHLRRGAHRARREDERRDPRAGTGPVFIGMTATGALIARHVTDLFPTQTSRFDLAQAARRGVIAPLRCVRIPPGRGRAHDRQGAAAQGRGRPGLRPGELAALLDQTPVQPGGRRPLQDALQGPARRGLLRRRAHAYNVAKAFQDVGMKAKARVGRDAQARAGARSSPPTSAARSTCSSTRSCSPRAGTRRAPPSACTWRPPPRSASTSSASGRVTRRNPGKEAGIVVDFVHPATPHDDPVVTLHSLLDRDVYRGGAIVVGPVRRGRGRRVRVERRVLPVTADPERRARGLRARAVAHRRRAPRLGRAARLGRARGRARGVQQLAPRARRCSTSTTPASCAGSSSSPACSATATRSCACARCRRSPPRATPRRSTRPSRSSAAGRATSAARA